MKLWPFGGSRSRFERAVDKYRPLLAQVNNYSDEFGALSDDDLKQRIIQHRGKDIAAIQPHIPEIFAGIREASFRVLKMRHFDVQILGGASLLEGNIAEMKTGEGKTLVATLPLIVRALTGRGAHLVTVNDYLAQRDAEWMRPVYEFFGLTVGAVLPGQSPAEKRVSYAADITYATNNEIGFDYLRDNMAQRVEDLVLRDLFYAIVDEVDSILIDEARTPLIISAPDAESTKQYEQFSRLVPNLKENDHFNIDEKRRSVTLTDDGISAVEQQLGIANLYAEGGLRLVHHLEQALRAYTLYHKDRDYVVKDGQVMIVDEFTGRLMPGRRYSEGLHQAIEAKEHVKVQQESRTLATITFQNFFRLYEHLAGMTGTAVTSAEEFEKVYNLDVVSVPTNKTLTRSDKTDRIYVNESAKFQAVVSEIKQRTQVGQPVLVGTIAIEKSEHLSELLNREGVAHEVLNAKNHAREAEIIAGAGQRNAVTISTNMAGRGTDIKLGEGVANAGGLFVLGTERHEARRIDNQLRGRSGRQGDPGETQFFVSLEDDVMRVFGGDRMKGLMQRLKLPADEPIENTMVTKAIEGAQIRVEGYYFDMRKQVLSYDDVLNRQRGAMYTLRRGVLTDNQWIEPHQEPLALTAYVYERTAEQAAALVASHANADEDTFDLTEIAENIHAMTGAEIPALQEQLAAIQAEHAPHGPAQVTQELTAVVEKHIHTYLEQKQTTLGNDIFAQLTKAAALRSIDTLWMDHLDTMDYLRTGIGLRGYGQQDPLVEYQKEGHRLFQELLESIKNSFLETVLRAEAVRREEVPHAQATHQSATAPHRIAEPSAAQPATDRQPPLSAGGPLQNPHKNIGRNDPCPCGSGRKYKKCGLINAPEHQA